MEPDKKDTKIVELKMDTDLLESVQNIALTRFNARINHKSNKPEVTATLNYLIRKGIENLDSNYQDSDKVNPIIYPDNVVTKEALDNAIAEVKNELGQAKLWLHETSVTHDVIAQLETKFDDKLGEFKSFVADTAVTPGSMRSAIAPLKEEIEALKKLEGIE